MRVVGFIQCIVSHSDFIVSISVLVRQLLSFFSCLSIVWQAVYFNP